MLMARWLSFGTSLELCSAISGEDVESRYDEVCSNVPDRFFWVLIARVRGFTAAVSDQGRATICNRRP